MARKNEVQTQQKQEVQETQKAERMHDRRVYMPRADIYETDDAIHLIANMAGVDQDSVDITLEKNVLTIRGQASAQTPEGMELAYSEYAVGDYERSFVLSDEIERVGIDAKMQDGVLDLTLPKSKSARSRRIPVKAA